MHINAAWLTICIETHCWTANQKCLSALLDLLRANQWLFYKQIQEHNAGKCFIVSFPSLCLNDTPLFLLLLSDIRISCLHIPWYLFVVDQCNVSSPIIIDRSLDLCNQAYRSGFITDPTAFWSFNCLEVFIYLSIYLSLYWPDLNLVLRWIGSWSEPDQRRCVRQREKKKERERERKTDREKKREGKRERKRELERDPHCFCLVISTQTRRKRKMTEK